MRWRVRRWNDSEKGSSSGRRARGWGRGSLANSGRVGWKVRMCTDSERGRAKRRSPAAGQKSSGRAHNLERPSRAHDIVLYP